MAENEKKDEQPEELPVPRLYIYPIDIMRMRGCGMIAAKAIYYRIRKKLKKKKGSEVTYQEYCAYVDVREKEVLPYLRMPPFLKLLILMMLFYSFSKLAVNHIPALKHYLEKHQVEWQEILPGYQKGTLEEKNTKTGKTETLEIEVEDMGK